MTLLFADGFDFYATAELALMGWTGGAAIGSTAGRNGTPGMTLGDNANPQQPVPGNPATVVFGYAFLVPSANQRWFQVIVRVLDGTTEQVSIRVNNSLFPYVQRGDGTVLGTSSTSLLYDNYYYFELKVTVGSGSSGSFDLHLNGASILSATGVNTQNSGAAQVNAIQWLSGSSAADQMDDVYICNTAGTVNNTFLGDVRVQGLLPSGAGSFTGWTTLFGAATQWQAVGEAPPDGDTSYIADATPGDISSFVHGPISASTSIVKAVIPTYYARKDDAGTRQVASLVRYAGTNSVGTTASLTTTYAYYRDIHETDPTGTPWTVSSANACEVGVEEIA